MGAFLSAIGGAGTAASRYGEQVRGLLESRRHDLADLITRQADNEVDPEARSLHLQTAADLLSGKPMDKVAPKFIKMLQDRHQGNLILSQAMGGPPKPAPPPSPFPTPQPFENMIGKTSGSMDRSPVPPAAQPNSNPLLPSNQPGPIATAPPAPQAAPAPAPAAAQPSPAATADLGPPPIGNADATPSQSPDFFNSPLLQTPAGRRLIEPLIQTQFTQTAELGKEQALRKLDLDERQKALAELENSPEWGNLPALMKSSYRLWAHSRQAPLPSMAASFLRPINLPGQMPSRDINPSELLDQNGNPIDPAATPFVRQHIDLAGNRSYYTPAIGPTVTIAGANGLEAAPRLPGALTPAGGGPAMLPSALTPHATGVDANGQNVYNSALDIQAGNPLGVNPSTLPTVNHGVRSVQTADANGNAVTELVPVDTSTHKKLPSVGSPAPAVGGNGQGAPPSQAPAPAPKQFLKPLTPLQKRTSEQQLGQYTLAIDRAKNVLSKLPLLNSLINAGKLNLALDSSGLLRAVINRAVKLSPEESDMVADFQTLREDINLLRGPLGATGFRGPEAFSALQAQRGQLLARPDITKKVLENTINAMEVQSQALDRSLHPNKGDGSGAPGSIAPIAAPGVVHWGRDAQGNPVQLGR